MQDKQIIALFEARSETAVLQAQTKYNALCSAIASRILPDRRDAEECVNDVFLRAWESIPPERPVSLSAYLGRITRNLALDRYAYNHAKKRNSDLMEAFEELEPCLPGNSADGEDALLREDFRKFINHFLRALPPENRHYFIRRYWYGESVKEISLFFRVSEEKVKSSLFRTRNKLRHALEKEGFLL